MSSHRAWMERFLLLFADPVDEERFADRYLRDWITVSQIFLLVGGAFFYVFFIWDLLVDPVHGKTGHMIRGLIVMPWMFACAAVLFTGWGRKYVEAVVLSSLAAGHLGIIAIYTVLDKGFEYASLAFVLLFMGTTAAVPIRSRYLAIASLMVFVTGVAGHIAADNARPGWLIVNILALACAISLGTVSAYVRERSARTQYLTEQALAASHARVDDLLYSILPRDVVQRIQAGDTAIAESLGEVSIIFADLAGFTDLARRLSPNDLVKILARLFSAFDKEAERYGIDRIKTIGDAYMAIGGIGRSVGRDHVEDAADFALAVQAAVKRIVGESGYPIDIRIGIHVGPVIAGVIGRRRPAFDCWGESVNLASRLESSAPRGGILVSETTYWRLRERFDVLAVESIDLKGIGMTKAFALRSRRVERTGLRLVDTTGAAA